MEGSNDRFDRRNWTINGRFLTQRMTGVQRYAFEIVAALDDILVQNPDVADRLRLRLVVPPGVEVKPALSGIGFCRTGLGSGHAWDQFVLPFYAGDGVLSLGNFGPMLVRNSIVCIHDANVFIERESYSRTFGLAYRMLLPMVARRAKRVATVSQFSADMLVKYGVCGRERIYIAPNGHEHALRWDASCARTPLLNILKRPYVLLLGSRAKHKNVDIVLEQAEALDASGIDIVVTGAGSSVFARGASPFAGSNIHQAGYVEDDDLAVLIDGALCLAFPSMTEGFGLPPLEAMARGCPVISSNAASLIEVGGEAVCYVDPARGEHWRDAIIGLSKNDSLRADMAARGRSRAKMFSWRRSAQLHLEEILKFLPA